MDPLAWPPPWEPAAGATPAAGPPPARPYPPEGWPSLHQLDYTQKLFAVVVIGLALPWLAKQLITNPGRVMRGATHKHIDG